MTLRELIEMHSEETQNRVYFPHILHDLPVVGIKGICKYRLHKYMDSVYFQHDLFEASCDIEEYHARGYYELELLFESVESASNLKVNVCIHDADDEAYDKSLIDSYFQG